MQGKRKWFRISKHQLMLQMDKQSYAAHVAPLEFGHYDSKSDTAHITTANRSDIPWLQERLTTPLSRFMGCGIIFTPASAPE
jgi:hypothetical protein